MYPMKIVFPKQIKILSHTFTVVQRKDEAGGSFDFSRNEIVIGTMFLKSDPAYTFSIICHEVMEAIAVITATRFSDTSVLGNYHFVMDHKQFEINISLFASVIQEFLPKSK